METTSHTKGPWRVDSNGDILDSQSLLIARPQHKKDASIIAAAPGLLDALSHMLADVEAYQSNPHGHAPTQFITLARAAIAKAKGATV